MTRRNNKAQIKISNSTNGRFNVYCFDCYPGKLGNFGTREDAAEMREQHRAEVHPNGIVNWAANARHVEVKLTDGQNHTSVVRGRNRYNHKPGS